MHFWPLSNPIPTHQCHSVGFWLQIIQKCFNPKSKAYDMQAGKQANIFISLPSILHGLLLAHSEISFWMMANFVSSKSLLHGLLPTSSSTLFTLQMKPPLPDWQCPNIHCNLIISLTNIIFLIQDHHYMTKMPTSVNRKRQLPKSEWSAYYMNCLKAIAVVLNDIASFFCITTGILAPTWNCEFE